jgi:hypothetical protein
MRIYNVGTDELSDWDFNEVSQDKYKWIVYWYENGGYDGNGEAVALGKDDDKLYCKNLGHCSCYGPMDSWETGCTMMSVDEFLKDKDDIFEYDCKEEIKKKVRRLTAHMRAHN